jgi:hypothetical protein
LPLNLEKVGYDLEFERLLSLASRLQISQHLRPAEIRGIQRPGEFHTLSTRRTLGENATGHSITVRRYRNGKLRKRVSLSP